MHVQIAELPKVLVARLLVVYFFAIHPEGFLAHITAPKRDFSVGSRNVFCAWLACGKCGYACNN